MESSRNSNAMWLTDFGSCLVDLGFDLARSADRSGWRTTELL